MGSYVLAACLACFIPLIVSMVRRFNAPETISTPAWLIATNALFILGGPVTAWLISGEDLTTSTQGAAAVAGVVVAYSSALALTYAAVRRGVTGVSGKPVQSAVANLKLAADRVTPAEVLFWSTLVIAIQAFSLSVYSLGLTGGNLAFDHRLHVPYPALALYMVFGTAAIGFVALLTKVALGSHPSVVRLACLALLFAEFIITVYNGRRELIWITLSATFGIVWSGKKRWAAALPLAVGLIYVIIVVFAPVFLRARAIYSGGNAPSVAEAYRIALDETSDDVVGKSDFEAEKNTTWRLRTYSFWEQLYESLGPGFTEGKILMQGVLMVLPRILFGYSKFALGIVDEALLGVKFDICNNVCLESYIDLGFFGPALYGLLFGALFAVCDSLNSFAASRYRMMAVLGSGVLMRTLFGPESNPIAYFSELRSSIIYALLAVLFAAVFGRKTVVQCLRSQADPEGVARLAKRVAVAESMMRPVGIGNPGQLRMPG